VTQQLRDGSPALLAKLLSEGTLAPKAITLALVPETLAAELGLKPADLDPAALTIDAPFSLRRRGVEARLIAGDRKPDPDQTLLRALAHAHHWADDLKQGTPLTQIATATPHSDAYVRTRSQLAFLSPLIQRAILDGSQPTELTLERIVRKPIPLDWALQEQIYGFKEARIEP
jgi:site-specific DNA recombinase